MVDLEAISIGQIDAVIAVRDGEVAESDPDPARAGIVHRPTPVLAGTGYILDLQMGSRPYAAVDGDVVGIGNP